MTHRLATDTRTPQTQPTDIMINTAPIETEITQINSKCWEWSITRNGDHLAGGYCKTKADAESDSAIAAKSLKSES